MVAFYQYSQGRRLHAADGQKRVETQGKRSAGVHAHQPVRLRPAGSAAVQAVVFLGGLQGSKALFDGLVCHGGDPQPVHGLFAFGLGINEAEDQFALPPGIGGADQLFRFRIVDNFLDDGKLGFGFGNHLGGNMLRQHGQIVHAPFFVFFIDFVRLAQRDQVPHSPGDEMVFPFQESFALFPAP